MLIGYARVSTTEQNLDLQIDALQKMGCDRIYFDKASGAKIERPELKKAVESCSAGDTLVVWKLDRLGRSLRHLIDTVASLGDRGVGFKTCCDGIDTTTSSGKLVFHIFAALAEFERSLIKDRTMAGLQAARRRGKNGGRPRLINSESLDAAMKLSIAGTPRNEIAKLLNVSLTTLWRCLRAHKHL